MKLEVNCLKAPDHERRVAPRLGSQLEQRRVLDQRP